MFQEKPRNHPKIYEQLMHDYWRSAFAIGAVGFCSGIMRSLAVSDPSMGSLVNIMSMAASLAMAIALLFVWQNKSLRINIGNAYRVFFPFLITGFVVLPFLGGGFNAAFASLIYAAYSCAIILMMIQSAQASRDRGINPVFIYGFLGVIVYVLNDIGFIGGSFVEQIRAIGIQPVVAISLFALYLLGLMYFLGLGGFHQALAKRQIADDSIELVALNVPEDEWEQVVSAEVSESKVEDADGRDHAPMRSGVQYRDRISKQCALLQHHYRLSAREAEVMELIVRGNSVARVAEKLVVSENTVRTHTKRIYTKLDIHKKQDLLDLIDEFDPSTLKASSNREPTPSNR